MTMKKNHKINFYCSFGENDRMVRHYERIPLQDIQKWVQAYSFTHPDCTCISVRLDMSEGVREL